jgi:mono/diheme cytochrome c family protein
MKSDLEEYDLDKNSVMPPFEQTLSQREIDDLVAYLATLKPKGTR